MSRILRDASVRQVSTLLSLFPIKALRGAWNDLEGTKPNLSTEIATDRDHDKISAFVNENVNLCRQHIYLFTTDIPIKEFVGFPFSDLDVLTLPDGSDVSKRNFLTTMTVEVAIWSDPPERKFLAYVLPVRIEFHHGYLLVRFVKFERTFVNQDIDFANATIKRNNHEDVILSRIRADLNAAGYSCDRADLHKGVKHLWRTDSIDAFRLAYKLPDSINTKTMNLKVGVKQNSRAEYDAIQNATFFACLFKTLVEDGIMSLDFTVNLAEGFISFSKYAEQPEDSDAIIEQILQYNR